MVYEQKGKNGVLSWIIDFIWVDPASGKKRRIRRAAKDPKGRPARSKTAAEQHEHRLRAALASGELEVVKDADASMDPLEEAPILADYLEEYLADARVRLKPQTVNYLQSTFRTKILPTLGKQRLDEIDMPALSALTRALHGQKLSAKTINNALSATRALLSHAADNKKITMVPRIKWQKVAPAKFDFFTFEEAARLIEHAPPFVTIALRTGMRIGELLALKWSDISFERMHVTVARSVWWDGDGRKHEGPPKNHKMRTIPLTNDGLAALESLPSRAGYVFVDSSGLQLRATQCKWPLWRAQDSAQLRRTGPHVLRHTFASHLVMRGVSLPAVQALMGHSTIQMTMKYAHLAPDHLRAAIDLLQVH